MTRYRYRKIKPEDIVVMKELRGRGLSYEKIGKEFNIQWSVVHYHLSPREKMMCKKRAHKSLDKMTKKQKLEKSRRHYLYTKQYIVERYQNDEEFRRYYCGLVKRSFEKRRRVWIEKGLCSKCGRRRKNKRWRYCERCREVCREASRKRYQAKKSKTRK